MIHSSLSRASLTPLLRRILISTYWLLRTADTVRLSRVIGATIGFGPKPASWNFARSFRLPCPIEKKSKSPIENNKGTAHHGGPCLFYRSFSTSCEECDSFQGSS